ncbi:MAG: TonB-dependent receptor [Pseudomonadota bacterium]
MQVPLRIWAAAGLAAAGPVPCALAQSAPVDEIVVEAARSDAPLARLPFAADVVEQDWIQDGRPLLGLDESLQRVPGLLMQNRFNYAQDLRISMRGFGARAAFGIRGIRIVVDGIPETLADGQGGIDGIDLGSARRVEVLRGGASAIYGNAGGGVILIESERGSEVPELTFGLATGSDGYERAAAKLRGSAGALDYLASASVLDFEGFRDHAEAENRQLNVRLGYDAGANGDWVFSLHHTDQPTAQDPGGINRAQAEADPSSARDANVNQNAGEALEQTRFGVRHARDVGADGKLTLRAYSLTREFDGLLPFTGGGAIDLDRNYAGGGVRYTHTIGVGKIHAGFDYDRQDDDRARFDNLAGARGPLTLDQNEQVTALGFYLQGEFELSDDWLLTLGLRRDDVEFDVTDRFLTNGNDSGSRTFDAVSPVAGITWLASDAVTLYANTSRSFESPTTTELANPSAAGGFNPDLEPQFARHYELGARVTPAEGQQLTAALFRIDLEDELIPFELAAFPGRDFFANAGESERAGVELAWQGQFADGWQANAAYTWSDFEFTDFTNDDGDVFDGNTVPGTAEHVVFAGLEYRADAGWFAAAEATHTSAITLNNANTEEADAYTLVTLRAGTTWQRGGWRFAPYASVTNLLDEDYTANARINAFGGRFFEPGPGRSFYLGVNVTRVFSAR